METKGIDFAAIPQKAINVLRSPSIFYREMPKAGGFVEPLVFMVVMGVIGGLLQFIFNIIGLHAAEGFAMGAASVIMLPIAIAIGGFIGAAILFVIWKFMGSQESYETAYRCGAYASALVPITILLGLIPYIGQPIGIVLMTFVIVIASVETHKIPSRKAWLVFGIIGAVLIISGLSAEFAARRMAKEANNYQKQVEEASEAMKEQTEEMQKQAEKAQEAAEEMQRQMEEMQNKK
ncbi:MAG: YIP1 family protein [Nitrospirae bacterium]|nr:YIP1 family protein [Nitrospirota bacterium]